VTTTAPPCPAERTGRGPGSRRRVLALAEAETRLLLRNRTAVFNSLLMPLLLVASARLIGAGEGTAGPALLVVAIGVTLVFLTYYNLVTTYVARREELVLQRMRTGELTDAEILIGTAAPTLLVTLAQVLLVAVGVLVLGEWSAPVDAVLPLLALAGGAALMVVLAAASTSFTRTAESAQITTLPLVMIATVASGLFFPLDVFPDQVATALRMLPLSPVVELARLGLVGGTWDGQTVGWAGAWAAAPLPLAVLGGWLLVGGPVAGRVFRWAPRR
jgi:ABC-2 type transport system permease protein